MILQIFAEKQYVNRSNDKMILQIFAEKQDVNRSNDEMILQIFAENNSQSNYKYGEITNKIIQSFYQIYNELGYGFENGIYVNALEIAFENLNLNSTKNQKIEINYNNQKVGIYKAKLIVENRILVQIFNNEIFSENQEQKVYNELKLCEYEVALILNFGMKRKEKG